MISLSLQENKNFNDELMNLISNDCESDDDDVCLIDGMDLEDDYITLSCKHKFIYGQVIPPKKSLVFDVT